MEVCDNAVWKYDDQTMPTFIKCCISIQILKVDVHYTVQKGQFSWLQFHKVALKYQGTVTEIRPTEELKFDHL